MKEPTIMLSIRSRPIVPAVLALALALALGGRAHAEYVVNVTEVGGDVVAVGSGTLDLTFLNLGTGGGASSYFSDRYATAIFGGDGANGAGFETGAYIYGSDSFFSGTGDGVYASNATGDLVGVFGGQVGQLFVPVGYVSGSQLNSTSIWEGQTFASLGMTPGTYVWSLAYPGTPGADFLTINIGASSVPEPASLVMLGTGAMAILGYARRQKRADA